MGEHVSARRVAVGMACVAAGASALLTGWAGAASATGGGDGPIDLGRHHLSADELGRDYGGGQSWSGVTADRSGRYLLDDHGTADTADDDYVEVEIDRDGVRWHADREVDAVEVDGDDGSDLYVYGGSHGERGRGDGHHGGGDVDRVRFYCDHDDEEHPTTTAPPTTTPPTSETPSTSETLPPTSGTTPETTPTVPPTVPGPTVVPTTPSTVTPTTEAPAPTTPPTTAVSNTGELPRTGNDTLPIVAVGLALVTIGGGLVLGRKHLQARA